jgi:hypothetical protein
MKGMLTLIVTTLILAGCSSSPSSRVISSRVIDESKDWGEFMQASPQSGHVYTFLRQPPEGLIELNVKNETWKTLDPEATNGKDLLRSGPWLAYRLGQSARLMKDNQIRQLAPFLQKLTAFHATEKKLYLGAEIHSRLSQIWEVSPTGEILQVFHMPGNARLVFTDPQGRAFALVQEARGLSLFERTDLEWIRHQVWVSGIAGTFHHLTTDSTGIHLALLNQDKGSLILAQVLWSEIHQQPSWITIDGDTADVFRGMDITRFGHPQDAVWGYFYLDAWALKLRMAYQKKGKDWKSEEVPVAGAVGFYSLVLSQSEKSLEVVTHAFRSERPDGSFSFENLVFLELALP